jgi:hypothetical protein
VEDKPPAALLTQRLRQWVDSWPNTPVLERRPLIAESREQTLLLLAQVANLADARQKRVAVQRVQAWIDDFNLLLAQQ